MEKNILKACGNFINKKNLKIFSNIGQDGEGARGFTFISVCFTFPTKAIHLINANNLNNLSKLTDLNVSMKITH